ncbi:MAG: alpha-amylase family glycosyl hydrolase [Pseudomonadota bacterium]
MAVKNSKNKQGWRLACALGLAGLLAACSDAPREDATQALPSFNVRPISDDVIYFLLPDRFANGDPANDRGGLDGDRLRHGYDPSDKAFYHGGDLQGVRDKLDYLADMGVTAIWLSPVFKNKPVQGPPDDASAAYHGYWITDFTKVDPHLGGNDDLKALVEDAHRRDIKVILDIITNHSADVIQYRECHDPAWPKAQKAPDCPYRSKADYPYTRRGGRDGPPINDGFLGDDPPFQTAENFARLTDPGYAYTPFVPAAEQEVKVPAWLNDLRYYHNRGAMDWPGEAGLYGDFGGLDDLFTEHPRVLAGMIEIYKSWISAYRIDGFRVDTARHVNATFWQAFVPAILAHAQAEGIAEFAIFGEVYDPDPASLARFTKETGFPTVLDFAFQDRAMQVIARGGATDLLRDLYAADAAYGPAAEEGRRLPTFLGNHDMGRFGWFLRRGEAGADEATLLKRLILGHALMLYGRGVPVIYYGDEQGFVGDGGDQAAREDMFESQVASYNDNVLIGSARTTADDNFTPDHPLYQALRRMTGVRRAHPGLRHGAQNVVYSAAEPGLFVFTRQAPSGPLYLVALNSAATQHKASLAGLPARRWRVLDGAGEVVGEAGGTTGITLPGLGYVVLQARG